MLLLARGRLTRRAPIPWERWRSTYPAYYAEPLAEKAARVERNLVDRHLSPEGLLVYRRACKPFVPAHPDSYGSLSDQAMWTGVLAGVWAFKHAVTGAERDRTLLLRVLKGLTLLHEITGKPGLLARAAFPSGLPGPSDADEERHEATAPHQRFQFRGDVSRDQYVGVLFGCATAAATLGIDAGRGDVAVRDLLCGLVVPIADHIWDHGLRLTDVDGAMTTHGDLRGYRWGVPVGPNAALCLGFQRLAHRLSGEPRFAAHYDTLVRWRYPQALSRTNFELLGRVNHNNDNMGLMGLYALVNLETQEGLLKIYDRSLATLWSFTRNEGNAFFHLAFASRFPLPSTARFDLCENLRLFPEDPRYLPLDLRGRAEVDEAWFRNRLGFPRNRTALPLHCRSRSNFVWTACPFQLVSEHVPPGMCASGVDFLLAYWMTRHHLGHLAFHR
jgi:hypothetical protein